MTTPSWAQSIVGGMAAGDPAAFAGLYERMAKRLLRVARGILPDQADAEDAVHDVFVNLAQYRQQIGGASDLEAYVFAILRHVASRRIRTRGAEQRHLQAISVEAARKKPAERVADDAVDETLNVALQRAMTALPLEQREVVLLKVEGELTFAQIAQVVMVKPNTVAGRYRYAMEKLKEAMKNANPHAGAREIEPLEKRI